MKFRKLTNRRSKSAMVRKGATMVTIVILLPVLFALAAFAINISYVQMIRAKTQIVTDIAARAAGRTYIEAYDENAALASAQEMAALNPIQDDVLTLTSGDLEFGLSARHNHHSAYTFSPSTNGNSVRITTQSFADGMGPAPRPYFPVLGANFDIRPRCIATNTQTTLDVALIVDRSGSMRFAANESSSGTPAAEPPGWQAGDPVAPNSRWLDLVEAVNAFCNELSDTAKEEKIALVSYSSDVAREIDLTEDYSQISAACNAISNSFYGGATNIGGGIQDGLIAVTHPKFARPWAENAIVLMSDGNHNTGSDPILAAQNAADQQVPIFTVSFSAEANTALMQQIADTTGGTHYLATNAQELEDAFREIARRLPSMLTE